MAPQEERLVKLLSLVDVLEPLSEEELRDLARRCPATRLDEGRDFYRPEVHDSGLFLILEGRVGVYAVAPTGKQTTLEVLGGGTVLWARWLQAVHGLDVHARALMPGLVTFMGREDLIRFVHDKPEAALRMMDLLAEHLGTTGERMAEIAQKDVLSRLASQLLRLLEDEGIVERGGGFRLTTSYTHEELGTMIGAERVAVTRALGRLQNEGVVETRRRLIRVTDQEALRHVAEQER